MSKSKCPQCPLEFRPQYLQNHIQNIHENIKKHSCRFCPKKFTTRGGAMGHMKRVHLGEKDLTKCPHPKCTVVLQSKRRAETHARKCPFKDPAKEVSFPCQLCGKIFAVKQSLRIHMNGLHKQGKPLICDRPGCGKSFRYHVSFYVHKKTHMNKEAGIKFDCSECFKTYAHSDSLKQHLKEAHSHSPFGTSNKQMKYPCYFCGEHFKAASSVDEHLRIHTKETPLKCINALAGCELAFRSRNIAHYHRIKCKFADPHTLLTYECKMCYKTFPKKYALERHIVSAHTCEKAYKCDRSGCGKEFSSSEVLKVHTKVHQENEAGKSFPCDKCQKVYKTSAALKGHNIRCSHVPGIRRAGFICYFCGKRLSTLNSLLDHMRPHTGERPLKCPHCLGKFCTLGALKGHLKKKHVA